MEKMGPQNIEYKRSWRNEYLKWICSFASADGNQVRQAVGFKQLRKLQRRA